jgi:hypothetical protein
VLSFRGDPLVERLCLGERHDPIVLPVQHLRGKGLRLACKFVLAAFRSDRASTHMRPTPTRLEIVASVKHARRNAKALAVPAFRRPPFALSCGAGADLRARA